MSSIGIIILTSITLDSYGVLPVHSDLYALLPILSVFAFKTPYLSSIIKYEMSDKVQMRSDKGQISA